MNICENINYPPPEKIRLAFGLDKCNNVCTRFLVARRVSVVGFLSGGRTIGTMSEGFCKCLRL